MTPKTSEIIYFLEGSSWAFSKS